MMPNRGRFDAIYKSPVGYLGLRMHGSALAGITFLGETWGGEILASPLAHPVIAQLDGYFSNPHFQFSLRLGPQGSPFQQRVWHVLCEIAPGQTITYGDLAKQLGTAPRSIGQACRTNPIPIVIPCHRVLARSGLGGYMGGEERALAIKRWLLEHERGS